MSRLSLSLVLLIAFTSVGCNRSQTPSPTEAAKNALSEMLILAEAGHWEQYVDQYYGEAHKFTSDEDRKALIKRFEDRWGTEVTHALREASTVVPEILDGERAVFKIDGKPVFVLYRTASGEWTFHL